MIFFAHQTKQAWLRGGGGGGGGGDRGKLDLFGGRSIISLWVDHWWAYECQPVRGAGGVDRSDRLATQARRFRQLNNNN